MMKVTRLKSAGAASYYAKDDYYLQRDEGGVLTWGGQGARILGLKGPVEAVELRLVLEGYNPDPDGSALSWAEEQERRGITIEDTEDRAAHAPGWDLTFSAPKSLSALALVAGDKRLIEAHEEAVAVAMAYAEENFSTYRERTNDGVAAKVSGKLVYAQVTHQVSRELDPQLHTHVIVANAIETPDGTWRALETKDLYRYARLTGAIYQAELQARVHALGYDTEAGRTRGTFTASGIDNDLLDAAFANRGAKVKDAITEKQAQLGRDLTPEEERVAWLDDRKPKTGLDIEDLHRDWKETAATFGIDFDKMLRAAERRQERGGSGRQQERGVEGEANAVVSKVSSLVSRRAMPRNDPLLAVRGAVAMLEERQAVFRTHDVLREALYASDVAFPVQRLEEALAHVKETGEVQVANHYLQKGLTTERALDLESRVVAALGRSHNQINVPFSGEMVAKSLSPERLPTLGFDMRPNPGQEFVVSSIMTSRNGIDLVQGYAGVGKSAVIDLVRLGLADLTRDRIKMYGLAPTNKVVEDLKSKSGLEAQTLASFVGGYAAARSKGEVGLKPLRDKFQGSWVWLDEASQVSNRLMAQVLEARERLGIEKMIISGDQRQLSSIEAGAPFRLMQITVPDEVLKLNTIVRQRDESLKSAIYDLAEGRGKDAYVSLAPFIREERASAPDDLVKTAVAIWNDKPTDTKIIVATNADRRQVNAAIREIRIERGEVLGPAHTQAILTAKSLTHAQLRQSTSYSIGDRIVFHEARPVFGIERGRQYNVSGIDHNNNHLILRDERNQRKSVALDSLPGKGGRMPHGLFTAETIQIAKGDQMVWRATDTKAGASTNVEFEVLKVGKSYLRIKEEGRDARTIAKSDPALRFVTHAYALTADVAQGQTYSSVVAIISSKLGEFANTARAYVMASRPSESFRLITDNAAGLMRNLGKHDGLNEIALHHVAHNVQDEENAKGLRTLELAIERSKRKELARKTPDDTKGKGYKSDGSKSMGEKLPVLELEAPKLEKKIQRVRVKSL